MSIKGKDLKQGDLIVSVTEDYGWLTPDLDTKGTDADTSSVRKGELAVYLEMTPGYGDRLMNAVVGGRVLYGLTPSLWNIKCP